MGKIYFYQNNQYRIYIWSQMQKICESTENLTARNSKPSKSYGITSSTTTISHISTHEFAPSEMSQKQTNNIMMTVGTYDCDFVLLQNFFETGRIVGDLEFKQLLRFKTAYPIMHCHLEYQFIQTHFKFYLVGYLIDIYSNVYNINFTKVVEIIQKYPNHPIQYSKIYQSYKGVQKGEKLYLQTPLMIKKCNMKIFTVNLKGQIGIIDLNRSNFLFEKENYQMAKFKLNNKVLAANHNHYKCKYESVIIIAVHNNRAPYVFVNCNSLADFQNQMKAQDKYQWMQDEVQVSFCTIDPSTNLVAVTTVTQNVSIYEIVSSKQDNLTFYYLKKKFAFFVDKDIRFNNIDLNSNIQSIHANKGMVFIITSREYIMYDLVQRVIKKRGKSSQISCLKWGGVIDRNQNLVATFITKGYNHINQPQSKIGKPNIHFKTIDVSKKI